MSALRRHKEILVYANDGPLDMQNGKSCFVQHSFLSIYALQQILGELSSFVSSNTYYVSFDHLISTSGEQHSS